MRGDEEEDDENEELDEDDNQTIWIQSIIITALIAVGAMVTFYEAFLARRHDLPEFAAVVRHTPVYGVTPGDSPTDYVEFKLKGAKEFRLTECACHSVRKSIATRLVRGDTILIRANDKFFSDDEYDVYSITSPQYGSILKTDDIQHCSRSLMWFIVPFGVFFGIVVAATTIVKLRDDQEERDRIVKK